MVLTRKKPPISMDFQDDFLRYIDVKEPDINAVHALGQQELPDGIIEKGKIMDREALKQILKTCVRKWKIKHREVQFHVPDSFVFLRKVEIPEAISFEEIRSYLYMEIGASLPIPFEDPIFDYVLIPDNEEGQREILLFVSPRSLVMEYAEVLEDASLKPIAADITPLSVYRLLHASGMTDPDEHIMCIQYHRNMINVSLFHEHQPLFVRELYNDIVDLKSEQPSEDVLNRQVEEIFVELDRIINFYTYSLNHGDAQISTIILLGDHPYLNQIEQYLKSLVNIPIQSLENHLFKTLSGEPIPNEFSLTIGLALKGVK